MLYDRELLAKLDEFPASPWQGEVFRHMFGDYPPERENQRGARWNPPETPAIYTSLTRGVVLAEAEFQIALQPIRPTVRRTVYRVRVALSAGVDLSDRSRLLALGVSEHDLASLDHRACQHVGGAIEWLGNDGLLVPSARTHGVNLVIFPNRQKADYEFRVVDAEVIEGGHEYVSGTSTRRRWRASRRRSCSSSSAGRTRERVRTLGSMRLGEPEPREASEVA